MIALRLFTLVLLFPACEEEVDAASDAGADAGLPECTSVPVQSMGGGYDFVWRDGQVDGNQSDTPYEGEATFQGIADGFAVWADPSGEPPLRIRMSEGLLAVGTKYHIVYRGLFMPETGSWTATVITSEGRLVLFRASGQYHLAAEAFGLAGLTGTWIPSCTARIEQACYVPSVHSNLALKTVQGEVGLIALGTVTRWESELGRFDVFLEEAVDGGDNDQGCSHTPQTSFWLTMRAVP